MLRRGVPEKKDHKRSSIREKRNRKRGQVKNQELERKKKGMKLQSGTREEVRRMRP